MQQGGTGSTRHDPWWEALPVLAPLAAEYLGAHARLPHRVRHASLAMDARGVGVFGHAGLLLGVPWPAVDDIVVEGAGDFARRVSREPFSGLDLDVRTGEGFTYITVATCDAGALIMRTTAARPHVLRSALRAVLSHFPQRPPGGLESGPTAVRIEDIPVFRGIPARPYRAVQRIEGRAYARTAFGPPPGEEEADMKLREAAAAVGANAIVDPTYVRGTMSWRWYPLAAFATAVVVSSRDAEVGEDARAQPIFSPDRGHWWDGAAWVDASLAIPGATALSPDGTHWWDGRSWRPRPGS